MKCREATRGRLGQASWSGEARNFIPVSQEAGEGPGGMAAEPAGNVGGRDESMESTKPDSPSMPV